jgi:hypothetical protein
MSRWQYVEGATILSLDAVVCGVAPPTARLASPAILHGTYAWYGMLSHLFHVRATVGTHMLWFSQGLSPAVSACLGVAW